MKINNCPICNENDLINSDYIKAPNQENWEYDCFKYKSLSTCKNCKFTFTAEVFDEGSLNKFYNTLYSGSQLSQFKSSENYEFTMRFMSHINFIKINIDLNNGMNILEIGPNENGMISTFRLHCKPNYFYFDQIEFPVINHFGGKRLGDYFSVKSASSAKINKKMDLIVLSHSFEHFEPEHLNRDILAMKLALKKNGHVSIEVPLELITEMHAPHTQFFNVKNMSLLFEKHGFEIIGSQTINIPSESFKNNLIKKSIISSELSVKLIKKIISIFIPRKIRLMLLKPLYEKKLKVLYDGQPYMRLLAKKADSIQ